MRFRTFLEEYEPTKEEVRRFELVRDGFREVVAYEDLVRSLKKYNARTKFPIHGQINFIINSSRDITELIYNLRRYNKSAKNVEIEKLIKQYEE